MNVLNAVRLTVTPSVLDLGNPDYNDYLDGYSEVDGHSVEVKANGTWDLYIRASQTSWTGTGGARGNKPRGDLQWSLTNGSGYVGLTGNNAATNVLVTSGSATSSQTVQLYYRVLWSWALDRAGTYTLPVVYTLTAP